MPDRVVEAYISGKLVATVTVSLDLGSPLTREYDFIKAAREMMDGVLLDQVDEWVVREPDDGVPEGGEDRP